MYDKDQKPLAIVVLAAGKGKRMNNPGLPKVLVDLDGKPLISYVLETALQLWPEKVVIITGHFREKVEKFLDKEFSWNFEYALQDEQLGTGHAVSKASENFVDFKGNILILCGDVPFLTKNTLDRFIKKHYSDNSDVSVLSTTAPNPAGYGRIVRTDSGFEKITEEKDAGDDIKKIDEINSGVFLVNSGLLFKTLEKLSNNNAQGEYYLTDIVGILKNEGANVKAYNLAVFEELQGINSPEDLEKAEEYIAVINK